MIPQFQFGIQQPGDSLVNHTETVRTVVVLQDGRLASGGCDNLIKIWNNYYVTATWTSSMVCVHSLKQVSSLVLASGTTNGTLRFWNISTGNIISSIMAHVGTVADLELLSNGTLVSGGNNNLVRFWNVTTGALLKTYNFTVPVRKLKLLNNSEYLAVQLFSVLTVIHLQSGSVVS
jgi:WD40 repeat protein